MTDKPNSDDEQTVTVAELMARYGVEPPAKGRAHRRRTRAGAVSVAELTGEIPALTPETLAAHGEVAADAEDAAPTEDAPAAGAETATDAAETASADAPETVAGPADTAADEAAATSASTAHDETAAGEDDSDGEAEGPEAAEDPEAEDAATADPDVETPATDAPADPDPATAAMPVVEATTAEAAERAHDDRRRPAGPVTIIPPIAQDFDDRWPGEDDADVAEDAQAGPAADVEGPAEAPTEADRPAAGQEPARPSVGSALRQWFGLAAQTVLGVVVGAAVFLGFIRLWDVLPYVALVLAVLVILAMAAVVRILRKTDDSVSILLAVVVGVIVTIGPLVFVLSSP